MLSLTVKCKKTNVDEWVKLKIIGDSEEKIKEGILKIMPSGISEEKWNSFRNEIQPVNTPIIVDA